MAFVFQTQRWKPSSVQNPIGPGHYNASTLQRKPKGALITPQPSTSKQKLIYKQCSLLENYNDQKLRITQENSQNKPAKNSTSMKQFKRTVSAKCTFASKQTFQSPAIFKPRDMNLEVTNSNKAMRKSFENSMIKTSLKKQNKSIHSQIENFAKKPFCDKTLRMMASSPQTPNDKSSNINYFNTMFTKSTFNPNLVKFSETEPKTQNVFLSSEPSFLKEKQSDNFIIASRNCKKQTINPSNAAFLKESYIFTKLDVNEDMQTTGIQDSLDDSFQYISDATPGPGEYDLRKQKPFYKSKIEKFGITEMRFKEPTQHQKTLNLNIKIPTFKKSSRAPQQKVSFGKSRPQTAKESKSDVIFYDDNQNIENRCIQNLIKDRQTPGTFLSKCNRFRKAKIEAYYGPDFFDKNKNQPITLPNSIFMSKVERYQRPLSPTANVDFQAQHYKTIMQKAQKAVESRQLLDGQVPAFYVSEARFKYKTREQDEEPLKRPMTSTGFGLKKKKEFKAFTFRKQGLINSQQTTQNPSPWAYKVQTKWLKPSHHIRFKF